jgi:hypothetical protein
VELKKDLSNYKSLFDKLKESILNIDPVNFCENYLTLDGNPFRLRGNGYKPFVDIYRYIGLKSLNENSLPIVLVKGRQVGATTMGVNLELFWAGCNIFGKNGKPPIRVAHMFPQLDIANYYSKTKLSSTINSSKQIKCEDGKIRSYINSIMDSTNSESIYFKSFFNDNSISVDSIGVNADRIRGRTYDIMFFDEVQDMFPRAIMNALKVLAQSKYGPRSQGVQIYMGTPKAKDSKYYEMWMASTQSYYHLGCERCEKYFPLYTPNSDEWESIWLDANDERCLSFNKRDRGFIVECTNCGHLQDKRLAAERGKWVHTTDPDELDENGERVAKYMGFHINQLYMPLYQKKNIIDQKPENNPLSDETSWNNEVLGEFYSGDSATISAEEIREKCGDFNRPMVKFVKPSECANEMNTYLGIDWGKKIDVNVTNKEGVVVASKGQSYTVATVIKVEGPKLFSIQFATKLQKRDLSYKLEVIDQIIDRYSIKRVVGDIGYGHEIMGELQSKYGLKVLASEALGSKIKGRIRFDDLDSPKIIRFEKDNQIEEFLNLLKKGSIRFPLKSWEQIAWLISHCSSMVAKPIGDRYGNVKIKYSKGLAPNDGLMALINAYLAYKFDVTNGFKNNAKMFSEQPNDKSRGIAIGVYCPAMKITG